MSVVDDPPDVLVVDTPENETKYAEFYAVQRDRFLRWVLDAELEERIRRAPAPTPMVKGGRG